MSDLFQTLADRLAPRLPAAAQVRAATSAVEAEHEPLGPAPTVLVVPAAERWTPVREAGLRVSQPGVIAFSCVVGLTFPGGFAEWSAVRAEIRAALLGWTPDHPEAAGPIEASGARLLAYDPSEGGRWLHAFDFNLPVRASYEHQN